MSNFESELPKGQQRFLAQVVEHALRHGRRSYEDFLRHFPPAAIMAGLADHPNLRANIIVLSTGVRPKIAVRKSPESCAEDLSIALDEDEADAETIVTLFDPDDRVRYLSPTDLWAFVTEGDPWDVDRADEEAHGIVAGHLAYMLDRALDHGLLTHRDVVTGITVDELARVLPRAELAHIITSALSAGVEGSGFSEAHLVSSTPPEVLTRSVALDAIWSRVLEPMVAKPCGFVRASAPSIRPAAPSVFPAAEHVRVSAEALDEAFDEAFSGHEDDAREEIAAEQAGDLVSLDEPLTERPAAEAAAPVPLDQRKSSPRLTSVPPPLPKRHPDDIRSFSRVGV